MASGASSDTHVASVSVSSTAADAPDTSAPYVESGGVLKSLTDPREYRQLVLANGLRVLLVRDVDSEKAGASLNVHVGHFCDPDEIPGLAHFCEHMLFLGTKKYPDENSYTSFLSSHGGRSNAYTAAEDTNYYFDVQWEHLQEALDRFAQFFLGPLFTEAATSRELEAVHSEHQLNLQDDFRRMYQLSKSCADPTHPFSKFATGDVSTLRDTPKERNIDVRGALLAFHEKYYSASIMTLCIVGRHEMDVLEAWTRDMFSGIVNNGVSAPTFGPKPYRDDQLAHMQFVVPVKDSRELQLFWNCPDSTSSFRSKPARYFSHLLGHEGPGSLLSYLKAKDLASGLMAGGMLSQSSFTLFGLHIELTTTGLGAVEDVITAVYQYLAMLKASEPQEWVFSECQASAASSFRFKSKEQPFGYVSSVSGRMADYPTDICLVAESLFFEWNPKDIQAWLDCFKPSNMLARVVAQSLADKCDLSERWYGTKYTQARIPDQQLAAWATATPISDMHLPDRNPFIATDFSLRHPEAAPGTRDSRRTYFETSSGIPESLTHTKLATLALSDARSRIWFRADIDFFKPKLNAKVLLFLPLAGVSARNRVMMALLREVVNEQLNEFAYFASVASLDYALEATNQGFTVTVAGFSHKLHILAKEVAKVLAAPVFTDELFARKKEEELRRLKNYFMDRAYNHCMYFTTVLTQSPVWHLDEQLAEVASVTADELRAFIPQLMCSGFAEAFVYGNATQQEAVDLVQGMLDTLPTRPAHPSHIQLPRCVQLPAGLDCAHVFPARNVEDNNNAIQLSFQLGPDDIERVAIADMLVSFMREPAFDQLRTKEQLGYVVFAFKQTQLNIVNLNIIVQSPKMGPWELDGRIEAFLSNFRSQLLAVTDEEFASHVSAAIAQLHVDKTAPELVRRLWEEIRTQQYIFDRPQRTASAILRLTKADILACFDRYIARGAPARRKLLSMVQAGRSTVVSSPATTPLVSTVTAEGRALIGGSAVSTPAPLAGHVDMHTVAPLLSRASCDHAGAEAEIGKLRQRLGLATVLNPVVVVNDPAEFRHLLSLYPDFSRASAVTSTAAKL